MLTFDVLVIGSGGAGMRAALATGSRGGLRVGLMTKMFPTRSATGMAQGGINSVLANADPTDSLAKHIFDTVKGGDFLGDQDAIAFFWPGAGDNGRRARPRTACDGGGPADGQVGQVTGEDRRRAHAEDRPDAPSLLAIEKTFVFT